MKMHKIKIKILLEILLDKEEILEYVKISLLYGSFINCVDSVVNI